MFDRQYYTLADLKGWSRRGPSLGVVGHPIKHSLSPQMHNAALEQFADLSGWRYFRFEMHPAELEEALGLFASRHFVGLNFTLPHKTMMFGLLQDLDDSALAAQAVNTAHYEWPGSGTAPKGYSTDGHGLLAALREQLDFDPAGRQVAVLGAGGAGQSAAIALERAGAAVWWTNRSPEKVPALIGRLGLEKAVAAEPTGIPWEEVSLIINSTSLGLEPGDPSPLDFQTLPGAAKVGLAFDMVYRAKPTAFVEAARKAGLRAADGLSMLLHQGARAFEVWTGRPAPVEVMREALNKAVYVAR